MIAVLVESYILVDEEKNETVQIKQIAERFKYHLHSFLLH